MQIRVIMQMFIACSIYTNYYSLLKEKLFTICKRSHIDAVWKCINYFE